MLRSSSSRPVSFIMSVVLTCVLSLSTPLFSRPFDWQYSRFGTPFAVFYNPALIGNNPGYTLGVDFKYLDDENFDVRGVFVVPVSKIMTYEEHLNQQHSTNFKYPNASYRSSKSAFSVGGMYTSNEDIFLSLGLVTPVNSIHTGVSVDVLDSDGDQTISANVAFSADIPRMMKNSALRLAFHKTVVDDKGTADFFGISVGAGGTLSSSPRMHYLPYDFMLRFNIRDDGAISNTEGTARLNFDLSHIHTSNENLGQTITGSAGVSFIRPRNESIKHKFFASLGVVFINRSSSTAVIGGYGEGNEKYGTIFHSAFRRTTIGDDGLRVGLEAQDVGSGQFLFSLQVDGNINLRSWVLRIDNERGSSIKTFSGGNIIPSSVLWDGLNSVGEAVNDNVVNVRLVLHGERGRVIESNLVQFERDNVGRLILL